MSQSISRRNAVLGLSGTAVAALGLGGWAGRSGSRQGAAPGTDFPRQPSALVRETVGASHRNLARVRELVEAHPALANAWWDWGFGDWESPLGAASHVGQREIAEYLVSKGARVDLFAAAMLGWVEVVRGFVAAAPGVQKTLGPHCLTLMHHARAGGEEAKAVVEYLEGVGGADDGPAIQPLRAEARERYAGTYAHGGGESERFVVRVEKERLEFLAPGGTPNRLHYLGNDEFFPAGVPSVRLRFESRDGRVVSVTIVDHEPVVAAERLP
ncbi:hypothetical protein PHYC_01644 [Phycisphaerales bacterium]|nr:hypothetical protein PHYC_01644 [Phycisphaerales bacterium]